MDEEFMESTGRDDLITEVLDRLDSVGRVVVDGAEAGFEILVRQAMVEGIANFVWAFLSFGVFLAILKLAQKMFRNDFNMPESTRTTWGYRDFGFMILAPSILPLLIFGVNLSSGIKKVINPGFYAIKYILDAVGS